MNRDDALRELRIQLPPGTKVRTILRHVSRSGMSRSISTVLPRDGEVLSLDYLLAGTGEWKFDRDHSGLKMSGCGMDMGFALVYDLSRVLYPTGFECIGDGCPSNDHSNGDRDYTPHHHGDGGYALRQEWI